MALAELVERIDNFLGADSFDLLKELELLREGLYCLLQLILFFVDHCQHTEKRAKLKGLKLVFRESCCTFLQKLLSLDIVLLYEMDLPDFALSICLLIFKVSLDAVEHIDALLQIFQSFRELPLNFVSNADVVHNPCVIGVSYPVFEQQLS